MGLGTLTVQQFATPGSLSNTDRPLRHDWYWGRCTLLRRMRMPRAAVMAAPLEMEPEGVYNPVSTSPRRTHHAIMTEKGIAVKENWACDLSSVLP